MMPSKPSTDITGRVFERLTVLSFDSYKYYGSSRHVLWNVKCECGTERVVSYSSLSTKQVRSCGCLLNEYRQLPKSEKKTHRLPEGEALFNRLYRNYRFRATKLGLIFELNKEAFKDLINADCFYCGVTPTQKLAIKHLHNGELLYNGIDRVDNAIGYIKGNVVSCCGTCNMAKRNMPMTEFLEWIRRLSTYAINKNHTYNL